MTGQFARFLAVGGAGFAVDGGLLALLLAVGVDPYVARLLSFPPAVVATWWLNRRWTFGTADKARPAAQLGHYIGVQLIGAAINYAVYAATIATGLAGPLAGFALGAAAALAWNFTGARSFVYRPAEQVGHP